MEGISRFAVLFFGYTEVVIGLATLISLAGANFFYGVTKPPAVFLFVFFSSLASFILGLGILKYRLWARQFLIFFAGYILLTKILIFLGMLRLSPPFEMLVPPSIKNSISLFYHFIIILFFSKEKIRINFK